MLGVAGGEAGGMVCSRSAGQEQRKHVEGRHALIRTPALPLAQHMQVHLFCAVYFMLYMMAFTGITIWCA